MKNKIQTWVKILVDSNIWIALATVCFYYLSVIQLGEQIVVSATPIFLFFSTIFTYTFFQILDSDRKKKLVSKLLLIISFLVLLVSAFYLSYPTLLILVCSALLTFLYATPFFSLGKNRFNFRKLWFLKSAIVALVWTFSCAVIPLLEFNATSSQLLWFSLEKFLFILAISLPYDIKDISKDRQEKGMTSFVMKFGVNRTKQISSFLLLFAFVLAVFIYNQNILVLSVPYVFLLWVNSKLSENTSVYWFTFWIDAGIIIYFLSYFLSILLIK